MQLGGRPHPVSALADDYGGVLWHQTVELSQELGEVDRPFGLSDKSIRLGTPLLLQFCHLGGHGAAGKITLTGVFGAGLDELLECQAGITEQADVGCPVAAELPGVYVQVDELQAGW